MIDSLTEQRGPLRHLLLSLSKVAAKLIEIGETRLSLLATELQEEVYRAAGFLLYAIAAIFLATIGAMMAALALVIAYWDSHRLLVSLLVSGTPLAASLVIALVLASRRRSQPLVLDHMLAELKREPAGPDRRAVSERRKALARHRAELGRGMSSYFRAIAIDFDGTLTHGGAPAGTVLAAIDAVRAQGLATILVTGRVLAGAYRTRFTASAWSANSCTTAVH